MSKIDICKHTGKDTPHVLSLLFLAAAAFLASPDALAADPKAARYYEDALTRYKKEDIDGSIIQLKNALQIDKRMLPVQLLLGKALMRNGDVVAAEIALKEALNLGVNRAELVALLTQSFLAQGKHKLIFDDPLFSLNGLPASVRQDLLLLKATASLDLGDSRAAMQSIDDARAIDPSIPATWLAEVPVRIRSRQFSAATLAVERALSLAPKSAEGWYQKGSIAHASGDLAVAISAYDHALTLDASHGEALIARAGLLLDLGRLDESSRDVATLRKIAPNEPRAAYLQALLADRNNQPQVAQKALRDLVSLIDPVPIDFVRYRPQLLMLNGLAHYGLNEPEKAKQYLEAFQSVQGNTPASKLLAQLYLAEGNVDRAIDVLETYLKANGQDGQAMTLLGSALMSKGHNARAASLMQKALESSDAPEFRTVLGLSLIRSGHTETGISELETAYKKNPRQTQAATALVTLYMRNGQPAKAVTVAEGLVKLQPDNAGFFNLLGMAKGQSGLVVAARTAFERALKIDAKFIAPQLNLARIETATGAYDAAATRLTAVLQIEGENTDAMGEFALLSERRGQPKESLRWLERANALSGPKEVRWGLALSDFHLRQGQVGLALEAVKKVSGKLPEDLLVLITYAKAQLANGDLHAARSLLTSATRVAQYDARPQVQIALLQLAANNLSGAAYSLDKALSKQPNFLPALALMAEVELRQGSAAKAEKRAQDIVASHPKQAVGFSLLGDIATARGQGASALSAYQRAHQLEPGSETLLRLFRATATQSSDKSASGLAEQWLKTHPKDLAVHKALADSYARSGNFPQARTAYANVLKLAPNDAEVLNNLANVLLRMKDPSAVGIAEQAVSQNPENANTIDTLGWALFQNGQTDRGLQLLREARLRAPTNPEIRYHLATVLAKTGRNTEAREELELALKNTPTFEGSIEARALLKSLK